MNLQHYSKERKDNALSQKIKEETQQDYKEGIYDNQEISAQKEERKLANFKISAQEGKKIFLNQD